MPEDGRRETSPTVFESRNGTKWFYSWYSKNRKNKTKKYDDDKGSDDYDDKYKYRQAK